MTQAPTLTRAPEPPVPFETEQQQPVCAFCGQQTRLAHCDDCGVPFCRRHGRHGRCRDCSVQVWLIPSAPDISLARACLGIGVVGTVTAVGALIGVVLSTLMRLLVPDLSRGLVEAIGATIAFGLGWWWYATVGQSWMVDD